MESGAGEETAVTEEKGDEKGTECRRSLQDDSLCAMTSVLKAAMREAMNKRERLRAELLRCKGHQVARVMQRALDAWQCGKATGGLEVEVLREICWEKLHTGHWKDVQGVWRDAYALAQLLGVSRSIMQGLDAVNEWDEEMKALDLALMMGGDLFRKEVESVLKALGSRAIKKRKGERGMMDVSKRQKGEQLLDVLPVGSLQRPLGRAPRNEEHPSFDDFTRIYLSDPSNSEPCVLKGLTKMWPAFGKWKEMAYFHDKFGYRTVPVEIGRHYLAEKWGQKMMTLSEFLTAYIESEIPSEDEEIGYLAQHLLFDQIPELKEDICVPEYCYLSQKQQQQQPAIHAWFGPKGTVSPLHYDRSENILAQVLGQKYVRLYAPGQTPSLHPIPSFMNKNSSQVDLDDAEQVQRLGVDRLEFVDLILEAGDALFIPKGWWHYVRSLDRSFSVSFWWNVHPS